MERKRIGFLGYDGVMALDLAGPIDAFTTAAIDSPRGQPEYCYETIIIGLSARAFSAESGMIFKPHTTIEKVRTLDTLIIPGGRGLRVPAIQHKAASWINERAPRIRRIASVCTGIYALAASGLLDDRQVTTHWRFARDVARCFPRLKVDPNALYLKDGRFYTCAGVTSGIDLSLMLIEEDFGPRVALAVARELVVYLKRPGGQEQFSEPLQFQTQSTDQFAELAAWMQGHLRENLSVDFLAERACLSPRHFSRRFKDVFGTTPAAFVEDLRLGQARERLSAPGQSIETVASSVGFASADVFRRAFERRFGVKPGIYRKHFHLHAHGLAAEPPLARRA
ncbi:MAG TPA: helix-turn-helix domain-containing protein [Bacteroidota bacterium]|nr:helix-turn-helix domain-containing protein [Bacteroidota bacterium]